MKHNLKICVSREPQAGGVVACRRVSLRDKLLTRLLGPSRQVMIRLEELEQAKNEAEKADGKQKPPARSLFRAV